MSQEVHDRQKDGNERFTIDIRQLESCVHDLTRSVAESKWWFHPYLHSLRHLSKDQWLTKKSMAHINTQIKRRIRRQKIVMWCRFIHCDHLLDHELVVSRLMTLDIDGFGKVALKRPKRPIGSTIIMSLFSFFFHFNVVVSLWHWNWLNL